MSLRSMEHPGRRINWSQHHAYSYAHDPVYGTDWRVVTPTPTGQTIAGPFDTRDEAEAYLKVWRLMNGMSECGHWLLP